MKEYTFEIICGIIFIICIAITLILDWLHNKLLWKIIIDGEPFPLITHLNVDRKRHEVYFYNITKDSWESITYSRLEIHQIRYEEEMALERLNQLEEEKGE